MDCHDYLDYKPVVLIFSLQQSPNTNKNPSGIGPMLFISQMHKGHRQKQRCTILI